MINLEHLTVPEGKETIYTHAHKKKEVKEHRNILNELPMAKAGTI